MNTAIYPSPVLTRSYHVQGDFADPDTTWNQFLDVVAATQGVRILGTQHHRFPATEHGQGLTGLVMLAESHASIHTWPEHGYAAVLLSTCGGEKSLASFGAAVSRTWPQHRLEYQDQSAPHVSLVFDSLGAARTILTPYQRVDFFTSPLYGQVMALDGFVQTTERDAFVYHEALGLVPLALHAGRELDVLIVGGGDGYALATVLRDARVRTVTLLDIDEDVVQHATQRFGNRSALADPRVRVVVDDAAAWLRNVARPGQFDVVLLDTPDPSDGGPGAALEGTSFMCDVARCLRDDGLMTQMAGSPWVLVHEVRARLARAQACFGDVKPYLATIPTYPGGQYVFLVAGKSIVSLSFASLPYATRWYSPAAAAAAMVIPPYVQQVMESEEE